MKLLGFYSALPEHEQDPEVSEKQGAVHVTAQTALPALFFQDLVCSFSLHSLHVVSFCSVRLGSQRPALVQEAVLVAPLRKQAGDDRKAGGSFDFLFLNLTLIYGAASNKA